MRTQPQDYHLFADTRAWLGIPNAADTLSNLAFLVVGAMGLVFLWRERAAGGSARFADAREMAPYFVFFAGIAATGAGSAWYHLAPDDARLAWDRLAMALAFTSFLAAVIAERLSVRAGLRLLWPLVALGAASVVYWRLSAAAGAEDLRPYGVVQFGSIAAILAIAALFRSRYTHGAVVFRAVGAYALAKVFELLDREIYALGELVSGHTLKHLAAAAGAYVILASLQRRQQMGPTNGVRSHLFGKRV